jgi:cyclophilin family peptidyl-prolyl cis-trans isomerase
VRKMRQRLGSLAAFAAAFVGLSDTPALAGGTPDCVAVPVVAGRTTVELHTEFGVIHIELLDQPGEAPETAQNFLNYVQRGDYDGMFFHRLVTDFVLQGGGYTYDPVDGYAEIEADPPVTNQYQFCNVRGSLAMAKIGGQPNSATNQFFISLVDNTLTLDKDQNEGFTVFAQVVPADMTIVDQIGDLHTEYGPFMTADPLAGSWTNLPVKHVLQRPANGFGTCLKVVNPDPHPQNGPTGMEECADQPALDAAIAVWQERMAPRLPPELVIVEQAVPEPGAVALLVTGAAMLTVLRTARRRAA